MVKLINSKSELGINSQGSAFKVVRTQCYYLVNKTVGMIKCIVEFILARNNYFLLPVTAESSIVSTVEKLITVVYNYSVPIIFVFKIFHDSKSPEYYFFPYTCTSVMNFVIFSSISGLQFY